MEQEHESHKKRSINRANTIEGERSIYIQKQNIRVNNWN